MKKTFNIPIVLIPYRRPEPIKKILDVIKQIKPKQVFVIADGPRDDEEKQKCDAARAIIETIDWECEIFKNYSDINLNCGPRIATGLSWVFKQVDSAIILEDDCLPDVSFFKYAEELLKKYKNNPRIMHIAGLNTQQKNKKFKCDDSYYFSQIAQIWGWATWKRAWETYDFELKNWPKIKKTNKFKKLLPDYAVRERWSNLFDNIQTNRQARAKTWDVQWFYNCLINEGLSIVPKKNLITNIGFGEGAGNLTNTEHVLANLKKYSIKFPLKHPEKIEINKQADKYTFKFIYKINNSLVKKIKSFARHYLPGIYYFLKNNNIKKER